MENMFCNLCNIKNIPSHEKTSTHQNRLKYLHPNIQYKCDICRMGFLTSQGLSGHRKSKEHERNLVNIEQNRHQNTYQNLQQDINQNTYQNMNQNMNQNTYQNMHQNTYQNLQQDINQSLQQDINQNPMDTHKII